MKVLIDMNLSPAWCPVLRNGGLEVAHWSHLGDPRATDDSIFERARLEHWVLLTQDLDFPQLLHQAASAGPSVILLRVRDELDVVHQRRLLSLMHQFRSELERGALMVIDDRRARVRSLPIG